MYPIFQLEDGLGLGRDPSLQSLIAYSAIDELVSLSHSCQLPSHRVASNSPRLNPPVVPRSTAANRLEVSTAIFTDAVGVVDLCPGSHRPDNVFHIARTFMAMNSYTKNAQSGMYGGLKGLPGMVP